MVERASGAPNDPNAEEEAKDAVLRAERAVSVCSSSAVRLRLLPSDAANEAARPSPPLAADVDAPVQNTRFVAELAGDIDARRTHSQQQNHGFDCML